MYKNKKFIAIIAARSGSKSIKDKNIISIGNENLIEKAYKFALKVISKDKKLIVKEGAKIKFENDSVLVSEGSIFFEGSIDKPVIIDGINGNGSIILSNNKFKFKNFR